ncbi:MAG: DUF177 domain-containing protein [Alphaproteobacteria bacterium]
MSASKENPTPEFSRRVQAIDVPRLGRDYTVTAEAAEREKLAKRFDLIGIDSLVGDYTVKSVGAGPLIRVEGRIQAFVTQRCVTSLRPVPATIDERIVAEFGPEEADLDVELTLEDEDPPEAFDNGAIDLGELTAQHLSLALDPFPRAEDAVIDTEELGEGITVDAPNNPFAALAALKRRK